MKTSPSIVFFQGEASKINSLTRQAKASSQKGKSPMTQTLIWRGSVFRLRARRLGVAALRVWLLLAMSMVVGCAFKPILLTEAVPQVVDKPFVTAAAIQALQARGYAIALANEATGTVTTEWADATGVMGKIFDTNTRKRVMVSVSPDGQNVSVQMTKQEKTGKKEWENAEIGKKETQQAREILQEILQSVSGNVQMPSSQPSP